MSSQKNNLKKKEKKRKKDKEGTYWKREINRNSPKEKKEP